MAKKSQLRKTIDRLQANPIMKRPSMMSRAIGWVVPYVGHSGVIFEKISANEWIVSLKNKRKVQNHIKQVHAVGMVLLAETSAVMIMAYSLPKGRLPLVKGLEAKFVKRSKGKITAKVSLTDEQIQFIQDNEKGEMKVEVIITDESGGQPVICTVTSAWIPKK